MFCPCGVLSLRWVVEEIVRENRAESRRVNCLKFDATDSRKWASASRLSDLLTSFYAVFLG